MLDGLCLTGTDVPPDDLFSVSGCEDGSLLKTCFMWDL